MSAKPSFFAELKRRNVLRAGAFYAAAVWALAQGIAQLGPAFGAPDWIVRWFVIAAIIGFPFWLAFAWFYEFTPQGLKRESEIDPSDATAHSTGRKLDFWIIGILCVAVVLLLTDRLAAQKDIGAVVTNTSTTPPGKSVAVLPFENLSADKDNEYFANGMQDMILTKLAGISDLKVISRTSTEKYASHPDNLKTVAAELGVATLLEGSVQKSGDQVLINVQLIDAASDNHLWAEAYSRKLDNVFNVEGEVAQKVADALKAKLTPAETAQVTEAPTLNVGAFNAFLKAEDKAQKARASQLQATYLAADADYLQAIALDPHFALAYARLAYNQLNRGWFSTTLTSSELAATKSYADRAQALSPNSPDAYLALGFYDYWGLRDYAAANLEFKQALKLAPNSADAISGLGYVARRCGHVAQGLLYLQQAVSISPRDPSLLAAYSQTLMMVRRYTEANTQLQRSLKLSPNYATSFDVMLPLRLFGFGDADSIRKAANILPAWRISDGYAVAGDIAWLINVRTYADVFDRHFDAALHAWDSAPTDTPKLLAGHAAQARAECEQLAPLLRTALAEDPQALSLLQQLSWVEVCMSHNADAIALAQRAVTARPISKDSYFGTFQLVGLAEIAAWADAPDLALKTIRQLLEMPAGSVMSITRLKLDPVFDPLRKNPRFQKLIDESEAAEKAQAKP